MPNEPRRTRSRGQAVSPGRGEVRSRAGADPDWVRRRGGSVSAQTEPSGL